MLFQRRILDGIAAGEIDVAFRRWRRAAVRPGSRLRTAVGVLEVRAVEVVADVTDEDARRAGYGSRAELLRSLRREGEIHRIEVVRAGPDQRTTLREDLTDLDGARRELARIDAASRRGLWTQAVLRLIAERPGVRAAELAAQLDRETRAFKADVRRLKELGLTESLEVGYRLSPRGRALFSG